VGVALSDQFMWIKNLKSRCNPVWWFWVVGLTFFPINAQSQTRQEIIDSLKRIQAEYYIIADSSIILTIDSLIILPDETGPNNIEHKRKDFSWKDDFELFYKGMADKAKRNRFSWELYRLVYNPPHTDEDTIPSRKTLSTTPFLPYEGITINRIYFFKIDPFGPSLDDPGGEPESWLARFGNWLQIDTRDFVIRNNLLFSEGDTIDPVMLSESERLLRKRSFIRDARIRVIKSDDKSADIFVITKDTWPVMVDGNFGNTDSLALRLINRNVAGTGQRLTHDILLKNQTKLGYRGRYAIENISGSFINGEVLYKNAFGDEFYEIRLQRDLESSRFRIGGGAEAGLNKTYLVRTDHTPEQLSFQYHDLWIIRSLKSKFLHFKFLRTTELTTSFRYKRYLYDARPSTLNIYRYLYYNHHLFLVNTSLLRREFYNSQLINEYGEREDIPAGWMADLNAGLERSNRGNRFYVAASVTKGLYLENSYLSAMCRAGTFFREGKPEQGLIEIAIKGFGSGRELFGSRSRLFYQLSYTKGINRFDYEYIRMSGENGISGLNGEILNGNERILLKAEQVIYPKFHLVDFNFALSGFAEAGMIVSDLSPLKNNRIYPGLGISLKINNPNLFFRTIQFRLAWHPVLPANETSHYYFSAGNPELFEVDDYTPRKPEIYLFR
jgi:hypothetical protein